MPWCRIHILLWLACACVSQRLSDLNAQDALVENNLLEMLVLAEHAYSRELSTYSYFTVFAPVDSPLPRLPGEAAPPGGSGGFDAAFEEVCLRLES